MKNLMCWMSKLWLGIYLLVTLPLHAQKLPTIIPMTPNAAEFSKYGTHPVDMSTGTPEISLPLYEINTGKIKVPISLSYHASGIKVTQQATNVGLGWSLNAGGIISRSVRGKADEKDDGWFSDLTTPEQIQQSSNYSLVRQYAQNVKDAHPDIFSYNFSGRTGKFLYRKSTQSFATVPFEPISIRRTPGATLGDFTNTFSIVNEDGSTYYFEKKELYTTDDFGLEQFVQSWYLTKIISYDRTDSVMFTYRSDVADAGAAVQEDLSFYITRTYIRGQGDSNYGKYMSLAASLCDPVTANKTNHITISTHSHLALSEIIFNQGKVVFEGLTARKDYNGYAIDKVTVYTKEALGTYKSAYTFSFTYDYFKAFPNSTQPYEQRLKLLAMQKQDLADNTSEMHRFDYNALNPPSIYSCAQDYWGFYNGASNGNAQEGSLLPAVLPNHPDLVYQYYNGENVGGANRDPSDAHIMAGMLEKITYPTGGYSEFVYQPNKYKTDITTATLVTTPLLSLSLTGIGKAKPVSSTKPFTVPTDAYAQSYTVTVSLSAHTNPTAADVAQRVVLKDVTAGTQLAAWEHSGDIAKPLTNTQVFTLQPDHSYQLFAVVDDNAPTNINVDIVYKRRNTSTEASIRSGGGIRIASISSYDGINAVPSRSVYEYGTNGLGILLQSDLDIVLNNNTESLFSYQVESTGSGTDPLAHCKNARTGKMITYYGTSIVQTNDLKGVPLIYDKVTQTSYNGTSPNGKTEYYFETLTDFNRVYNPTVAGGKEVIDNSFLAGKPAGEISYKYDPVLKTFSKIYSKGFTYSYFPFGMEESGAIYKKIIYLDPQDTPPCGINTDPTIQYQEIQRDFGVLERTKVKLQAIRQESVTEERYDDQGNEWATTTSYTYGNLLHLFPTEVTTTNSKAEQLRTVLKYPHDFAATAPYTSLVSLNVLSPVIEKLDYKGTSSLLQATRTNYKVWNGNAKQIYPETVETKRESNAYETRIRYYAYDELGNPMSVSKEQDVHIDYGWGYYQSRPIAQVSNTKTITQQPALQVLTTSITSDRLVQGNVATFEKFGPAVNLNIAQVLRFKITLTDPVSGGWPAGARLELGVMNSTGQVTKSTASAYYDSYGIYDTDAGLVFSNLPLGTYTLAVKLTGYPAGSTKRIQVKGECSYQYSDLPTPSQYYFHTSFEDEQFTSTADAQAQTGRRSHTGPFQLPVKIPAGQYVLSYWQKTSLPATDWTYVQQPLTGNNTQPTISVPADYQIDEVRLHAADAQMTTYTYDPLVGMTSTTDAANVTTYYEYDGLGRLKRIKDQEGNIVKQYVYQYKK